MHHVIGRALVCAGCLSIFSHLSLAQSLDEVVVTAKRFPERALAAPIGMRVITAEDIAASTARSVPEVLGTLGGAHVRNNSGSTDLQIDLRGFGITGDDNTLILLDGVRIEKPDLSSRPLSAIPLEMIERIEIMPGAGAVLYGSGATGGTINIITKSPRAGTKQLSVLAGVGSFDAREYSGTLTLGAQDLGLSMSAKSYDSDNYRVNNDLSQKSLIGNLRWKTDATHASLRFGGDDQELGLPGYRSEAQLRSDRRGTNTPFNRSNIETRFGTLNAGTRIGTVELETDLSYRKGSNNADYVSLASTYDAEYDTTIVSPRLRWSVPSFAGISSELVSGVEWLKTDWSSESAGSYAAAGDSDQESDAFYAMWFANLGDTTRFNYGWRVQRLRNERRDVAPSVPAEAEDTRNLYAQEIGLRQDIGEFFSAHIKRARSFRVANADENYGLIASANLLKPQTSTEVEGGIEFHAETIRFSAVIFDIKLEDEIIYSPLLFTNINLSPTRRRGVELTGRWQVMKNLTIGGVMSFLDATFRSGVYSGVDVSGNDVPLVPDRLANLYVTWQPMQGTTMSLNYNYVGKQRYDNDQANTYSRMPSYSLVGLSLSQEVGKWLLTGNVDNLFDKSYYTYGITEPFSCPSFCAYPEAGRTFFVSAAYRFR